MADMEIRRPHSKAHDEAKKLAEGVAKNMQEEFGMNYEWVGDVINFSRSGVSGTLAVAKDEIVVQAKLGFLLSALKPKIISEVNRFLDEKFG